MAYGGESNKSQKVLRKEQLRVLFISHTLFFEVVEMDRA